MPPNTPFGHCPECLLELGFGPLQEGAHVSPSPTRGTGHPFADYELIGQIGRGGMGVVYKARQKSLNRFVALKMIVHAETASPAIMARFHLEAEAAASLEHPDIVSPYEIGEHDGQPFFSMRLIEGSNLAKEMPRLGLASQAISKDKSAPSKVQRREAQERIARLVAAVARAIHYAHQHGVVHRDLKPTNILIDLQGRPHLTDFGVAKILTGQSELTGTADILGTPSYMAPEQAAGKPVAGAADIYSLGAILYELLTGRPPFRADTPMETLRRVAEEEPTHPTTLNRQADGELATICLKCLEKDPLRRYSSAEALAEDLDRWLRHETIRARRAGLLLRTNRWVRRNPAGAGLIAVLFVALALVVVLFGTIQRLEKGKREALNNSLKAEQEKGEALQASVAVLREYVMRDLNDLWETSNKRYASITSETLATLRGDLSLRVGSRVNTIDLLFAVYTHEQPGKMLVMMAPILAHLERTMALDLSRPVRIDLRIYRHYDDGEDALVRGDADFMRVGPAIYVKAKKRQPGISLLLAQNGRVKGCIVVNKNAGIDSLIGLKGKRMAFVEGSSTTGNYLPKVALFEAGLTVKDLQGGGTNFLGSHDSVVKAVAEGRVDAGAANYSVASDPRNQGAELKILREFPEEFAGLPWVASHKLRPDVAKSIRTGLLAIHDKAVLQALGNNTTGFDEVHDEGYDQPVLASLHAVQPLLKNRKERKERRETRPDLVMEDAETKC